MAIRTADGDRQPTASAVAQIGDALRKVLGGEVSAALVEQEERGSGGNLCPQPLGFVGTTLCGGLRAAFGKFRNAGKFQSDRRSALRKTPEIAVGKLLVGAGLHPAHGMY